MHFIRSVAFAATLLAFSSLVSADGSAIKTHVDAINTTRSSEEQIPKLVEALNDADNWKALAKMPKADLKAFKKLNEGILAVALKDVHVR